MALTFGYVYHNRNDGIVSLDIFSTRSNDDFMPLNILFSDYLCLSLLLVKE